MADLPDCECYYCKRRNADRRTYIKYPRIHEKQLVWFHVKGMTNWPATVVDPHTLKAQMEIKLAKTHLCTVLFFEGTATPQHAHVNFANKKHLFYYKPNYQKFKKGSQLSRFVNAVQEAEEYWQANEDVQMLEPADLRLIYPDPEVMPNKLKKEKELNRRKGRKAGTKRKSSAGAKKPAVQKQVVDDPGDDEDEDRMSNTSSRDAASPEIGVQPQSKPQKAEESSSSENVDENDPTNLENEPAPIEQVHEAVPQVKKGRGRKRTGKTTPEEQQVLIENKKDVEAVDEESGPSKPKRGRKEKDDPRKAAKILHEILPEWPIVDKDLLPEVDENKKQKRTKKKITPARTVATRLSRGRKCKSTTPAPEPEQEHIEEHQDISEAAVAEPILEPEPTTDPEPVAEIPVEPPVEQTLAEPVAAAAPPVEETLAEPVAAAAVVEANADVSVESINEIRNDGPISDMVVGLMRQNRDLQSDNNRLREQLQMKEEAMEICENERDVALQDQIDRRKRMFGMALRDADYTEVIGVIGDGMYIKCILKNLVRTGASVVVYVTVPDEEESFLMLKPSAASFELVKSPKEVIMKSGFVLWDSDNKNTLEDVVCNVETGIVAGFDQGLAIPHFQANQKGFVILRKVDAVCSEKVETALKSVSCLSLHAFAFGFCGNAHAGQLTFAAAGDKSLFKRMEKTFSVISSDAVHTGTDLSVTSKLWTALNMLKHSHMEGYFQALSFILEENGPKGVLLNNFIECAANFMSISSAKVSHSFKLALKKDFRASHVTGTLKRLKQDMDDQTSALYNTTSTVHLKELINMGIKKFGENAEAERLLFVLNEV